MVPGARLERACPAFQTGAWTSTASLANLVEEEGIEPSFAGCRPAVLPLNDSPEKWLRAGELNATRMAYEASMTPVHLPAEKLVREAGVEPAAFGFRSSARTLLSFSRSYYTQRVEPRAAATGVSRCAGGFKRCVELAFPDYRSGASPTMLTGRLPCNCSPVELHRRSQRGYSKPRPPHYECGALPLQLLRHVKKKLERVRRIELR